MLHVIPDANVLIHGKALADLPWSELGHDEIEVLIVAPAVREIDKLKTQSGRPNRLARDLSSSIRKLGPGDRAEVRKANPHVVKRVELKSVGKAKNGLRLDHADQALINYALHLRGEGLDVLLLTDDTICGATASEFGLPVKLLPEHWLRDAEPDEREKAIARLQAENRRLQAAEPRIELAFSAPERKALRTLEGEVVRWLPLEESDVAALMEEIGRLCPPATTFERPKAATDALGEASRRLADAVRMSGLLQREVYEPATDEEIERYKAKEYPAWLAEVRKALESLHHDLQGRTGWPSVVVKAANVGTRPALDVRFRMMAHGAFTIADSGDRNEDDDEEASVSKKPFRLPLPPEPPRGRFRTTEFPGLDWATAQIDASSFRALDIPRLGPAPARQADAFYWRSGRNGPTKLKELECMSWRHHRDEGMQFELTIAPDELVDTEGALEVDVHAANLSDPAAAKLPVRIRFVDAPTLTEAEKLVRALGSTARAHKRL